MPSTGKTALFIFRRDLRLADNTALRAALQWCDTVLPCFIFDPRQLEAHPYRSSAALQFMLESLEDLQHQLSEAGGRLYCFFGPAEEVVARLLERRIVQAVFFNRDYTPFSRERDSAIRECVLRYSAECFDFDDVLLNPPGQVLKADGNPYTVFSAFFRASQKRTVAAPLAFSGAVFFSAGVEFEYRQAFSRILESRNENLYSQGGRKMALRILDCAGDFASYAGRRDFPALGGTTGLSPHLKFGTCSVREAYHRIRAAFDGGHALLRQLYWRDFFTHIAWHFPRVFGAAFNRRFEALEWQDNSGNFDRWCRGETGFPIVDAGMRELNASGFMHNRVRMLAGSFLVKDLHVDWRRGEKYFAARLVDYDPAVNNGNWQWVASTGCDAQPWFRIFNPWLQQKKFDSECRYIKKWITELQGLAPGLIHNLHRDASAAASGYPAPCVDHQEEKAAAEELYESAGEKTEARSL